MTNINDTDGPPRNSEQIVGTPGSTGRQRVSQALENVASFLKGRQFPGTVRVSGLPRAPEVHLQNLSEMSEMAVSADLSKTEGHEIQGEQCNTSLVTETCSKCLDQADVANIASLRSSQRTSLAEAEADSPTVSSPLEPSHGNCLSSARTTKLRKVIAAPTVNLRDLSELVWGGCPPELRPTCWRLLLGYVPPNASLRAGVLSRKRQEYQDWVQQHYDMDDADRSEDETRILHQIRIDLPRTAPGVSFFHKPEIQRSLERILYVRAIRNPGTAYVQGMNDLVTPFIAVFLTEVFPGNMQDWDICSLELNEFYDVEADCYWCLSKVLDSIQDHYTFAQPGIQILCFKLSELVRRVDQPVHTHMKSQEIEFLHFTFRWVNCLLLREIPFLLGPRLWDTYLAEGENFQEFLLYTNAAFLLNWSEELKSMDFQEMITFLQNLPTNDWGIQELEMVLSRAHMWRIMFGRAPNHLVSDGG